MDVKTVSAVMAKTAVTSSSGDKLRCLYPHVHGSEHVIIVHGTLGYVFRLCLPRCSGRKGEDLVLHDTYTDYERSTEPLWYAIHTRSRHEKVVRDQFAAKQIDHLLPLHHKRSKWKDRIKMVEVPLFGGYIFAHFALIEKLQVLQTVGVVRVVGINGMAEPIPEEQIETIRKMVNHDLPYDPYPYLQEGMLVRVVRGPLQGAEGILVEKKKNYRFVISIDLIQKAVAVDIDSADVEPVR
jgi:transcription antitermination factor NusG